MRRRWKRSPTTSSRRRGRSFSKAVELDPKFGIGYQRHGRGVAQPGPTLQDAEKYINRSAPVSRRHDRARTLRTRGLFYRVTGDYQQCVKEYGDLIARYAADVVGAQQARAVFDAAARTCRGPWRRCGGWSRSCPSARSTGTTWRCMPELRGRFPGRGTRGAADQEPGAVRRSLALAFAQIGTGPAGAGGGNVPEACDDRSPRAPPTRRLVSAIWRCTKGDSRTRCEILEHGAAADLAAREPDRAAAKFAALAYARPAARTDGRRRSRPRKRRWRTAKR